MPSGAKAVLRGCFMAVDGRLGGGDRARRRRTRCRRSPVGARQLRRDRASLGAPLLAGIGLLAILATIRTVFDALDRRGGTAASLLGNSCAPR